MISFIECGHHHYVDLFINQREKEKVMQNVMKELKNDSQYLSRLCGKIFRSHDNTAILTKNCIRH